VKNTRHGEECLENKLYEIVIGTAEGFRNFGICHLPKLDFGDFSKKIWTLKDKILVSVQVQEKLSRVTDNVNP
jgi:hypothetical protein